MKYLFIVFCIFISSCWAARLPEIPQPGDATKCVERYIIINQETNDTLFTKSWYPCNTLDRSPKMNVKGKTIIQTKTIPNG